QGPSLVPTLGIYPILSKCGRSASLHWSQTRPAATAAHPQHPVADRLWSLEPKNVGRHGERNVFSKQTRQRVDIVTLECRDIAIQHLRLCFGEVLRRTGIPVRNRRTRAL